MKSLFLLVALSCLSAAAVTPEKLRAEHLENPLALGTVTPRLSWQLAAGDAKDIRQTAYEIEVSTKPGAADLWTTGKVESSNTSLIPYAGKPLTSRSSTTWRVRSWIAGETEPGPWSEMATFEVGLLAAEDWQAEWIEAAENPSHKTKENVQNFANDKDRGTLVLTPAKHLRKEFESPKEVAKARLHITSLGVHTVEINGKRIGDWFLAPGSTSYDHRINSLTYDVTQDIRSGKNVIGATLADGWYSGYFAFGLFVKFPEPDPNAMGRYYYGINPALKARLDIEYSDGSKASVVTDQSWKSALGPYKEADILMGETYDAREEIPGWSIPGFDDSSWKPVAIHKGSKGAIDPHPGVPVRAIREITPVSVTEHKPGTFIFDLGQNISGVVRLKVKGKAGDKVTLRFAEVLHNDGRLSTENLRCARTVDTYILKGDPAGETWTPEFTYHGFQYVELTGFPGKPDKDAVTGVVIHSDTPFHGEFVCDDEMLNKLHSNITWTQRGNFFDVPTDCPQRDERMGWTGDAQIYVRAATYNADIASFYTKWLRDLNDDQWEWGAYPNFAPRPFVRPNDKFASAWGDAGIICPWTIWRVYGDTQVISEHWDNMEKFMKFRADRDPQMKGTAKGDSNYGDWLSLYEPKTPIEFIDLAYHAHDAGLMAEMAAVIGKTDRQEFWKKRHTELLASFQKIHLKEDGSLDVANQSTYAMSLKLGLIPDDMRVKTGAHLAKLIRDNGNKMSTGFLGTRPLLPALSSTGHHDLSGILMQQKEYPSWGYEVENGATTIWERWNSYVAGKGVHDPGMNSFSHYAFGAVSEWMFSELGGIDLLTPGYDEIRIAPRPTGTIKQCSVSTGTRHGKVSCSWKIKGDNFSVEITIPPNASASVALPIDSADIPKSIGSGTYSFSGKYTAR
ncbi:family 78 glycoside hydrolase catalytic domain [Akkermansiaceae bacterium]|nr:family 78 glycoside hydrolase catalytic domain [Akkermansiaceae bacterium]